MEDNVILTMRGICMTFPGVKALDHVDFTLRKGEIMALMGENGAGKSTLIKCLTGVNKFEAGEIHLEGIKGAIVNKDTLDAQKKGISTVYQEVNLCPNLSVAENLFIGREPMTKFHTVDRRAMNKRAEELMKSLNLPVDVRRKLEDYSIALQEMVAIARAVDMDSKVLILDEPTRGVDVGAIEMIHRELVKQRDLGKAILLVSLELDEVMDVPDRILVIYEGEIMGEFDPGNVTVEELGLYMTGSRRQEVK